MSFVGGLARGFRLRYRLAGYALDFLDFLIAFRGVYCTRRRCGDGGSVWPILGRSWQ